MPKVLFSNVVSTEVAADIIKKNSGDPITIDHVCRLCREYQKNPKKGLASRKMGAVWMVDREAAEKFQRTRSGPKRKTRNRKKGQS